MKLPRRKLVIENRSALFDMDWSALWEYRELLYILVWRDIKVRYKQTAIGVSRVVLQPLVTMLIFTAIFGYMAKVPSDGVWYPVFSLTALLPWTYFAQAITRSGESVVFLGCYWMFNNKEKSFWEFHRSVLSRLGYTLRMGKVTTAALVEVLDLALNPLKTSKRIARKLSHFLENTTR